MATAAAINKRLGEIERRAATAAGVCYTCGQYSKGRQTARRINEWIARVMAENELGRADAIEWLRANAPTIAKDLDKADLNPATDDPIPCWASDNEQRAIEDTGECSVCGQLVPWSSRAVEIMRPVIEQQIATVMREKAVNRKKAIAFIADWAPFTRPYLDALET